MLSPVPPVSPPGFFAVTGPPPPPPHAAARSAVNAIIGASRNIFLIIPPENVTGCLHSPADTQACCPRQPRIRAAVSGAVVHVCMLHSGLQLQPVTVEIIVRADINLVVLVTA